MHGNKKSDLILNTLQKLLSEKELETISVSEIAREAGIAKGGIYYYFPSKEAMMEALVERNYQKSLEKAKLLTQQKDVSPLTRAAMIFHTCVSSYEEFNRVFPKSPQKSEQEMAFLHQKHMRYLIRELKPVLTPILEQGIEAGQLRFERPSELSEIILIVLTVKLENSLVPSDKGEIEDTIQGLISLLEKGTECRTGALDFMKLW